jgi:hypothetical protein
MGDSIATNLFMLGFAYQKGAIPVSEAALLRAIELNGVAVEANKKVSWGRRAAVDLAKVEKIAIPAQNVVCRCRKVWTSDRSARITDGLSECRLRRAIQRSGRKVRALKETGPGQRLSTAVAKYYFKLMAYKDEYEVARLYTNGDFTTNSNNSSKVISACNSIWHRRCSRKRMGKVIWSKRNTARGCGGHLNCWRNAKVCAVRRWISSATPKNVDGACADYRLPRSDRT